MKQKWISGIMIFTLMMGTLGVITLPAQAAEAQNGVLLDDMVEGQTLYDATLSKTDNIGFTASSQKNVFDTTRAYKVSDETTELDEETYLTYVSETDAMTAFQLRAAFHKTKADGTYKDNFRFETSSDGEQYTALEVPGFVFYGGTGWTKDMWGEGILSSNPLPAGTHYLRVYFPPTKDLSVSGSSKYTHIGRVTITTAQPPMQTLKKRAAAARVIYEDMCSGNMPSMYSYVKAKALCEALEAADAVADGAEYEAVLTALDMLNGALQGFVDAIKGIPATFVDECNSTDKTIASYSLTCKVPADFTNQEDSEGKTGDSTLSASAYAGSYFAYQVDDTKTISNLMLEAAYSVSARGTLLEDMIVKAAPAPDSGNLEDAVFTEVEYVKELFGSIAGKWDRYRFTVPMLPKGTKYIWIEFPDLGNSKSFIQVTAVKWAESQEAGFVADDYTISQKYAEDGTTDFIITYTGGQASKEVCLIVAEYQDGKLAEALMTSAECAKDTPTELKGVPFAEPAEGHMTKVFLWNNGSMIPLTGAIR